jgi:chromate transporter
MTLAQAADDGRARPESLTDLYVSFTWLALQGFGGVLAVVQRELVERKKWFTREEFVEEWAVAQVMPGPNVVNLGIILGARYFGWRGSLATLAGLLSIPLVIVLALAMVYSHFAALPQVASALRGMGAVAAGVITATGMKLIPALRKNPLGPALGGAFGVAAFVAIAWLRVPLVWVLFGLGGISCFIVYRRLEAR